MSYLKLTLVWLVLSYLAASSAFATGSQYATNQPEGGPIGNANVYYEQDHFQWTNYNDDVHILLGFSATVVGALVLEHKLGMRNWTAALTMALIVTGFGVAKEVLHDTYTSRTDIKTWAGGALAGGLTVWALQF